MNTKKPLQAKCTERILKAILPNDFKIVSDKTSNGYKLVNLLYGVEFDKAGNALKDVYNNSFLSTFDNTKKYTLYEVSLSGTPNDTFINKSGTAIKITNEDEFYNGDPTRLVFIDTCSLPFDRVYTGSIRPSGLDNSFTKGFTIPCWSSASGFIGLEYLRSDPRGSGYLLVSTDLYQSSGYYQNKYSSFLIDVGSNFQTSGDYKNIYGFFTGIETQDYNSVSYYETLEPLSQATLTSRYPLTRQIQDDSGVFQTIDHYTPYHGWMRNETGLVTAVVDYGTDFYYDDGGGKTYYRTAYNNPYGSGNYTTAYLSLEYIPLSGTLRVYDADILDISGNATEIPSSGKALYYYKSSKMIDTGDPDALFDPIYMGYSSTVPSGEGFSSFMEGSGCSLLKTTSWSYLHDGLYYDEDTLQWVDGQGDITNKIALTNYNGKYIVEYKYKTHDQIKYITSSENNGAVSLYTRSPIYSTSTVSGNLEQVEYEFTQDPSYGNESSKIITFDGIKERPYKQFSRIDFSIPFLYTQGTLDDYLYINTDKSFIGYTNEMVPQVSTFRNYMLNCCFDSNVSGNLIERDLSGKGNDLHFSGQYIYKINYDSYFGKKILSSGSYYYINNTNFLQNFTYFQFDFKVLHPSSGRFLELQDTNLSGYIYMDIDSNGFITLQSNGGLYNSTDILPFNNLSKSLILSYNPDDLSSRVSLLKLYYKQEEDFGYKILNLTRTLTTPINVTSSYLHCYKNMDIDVKDFKIYQEAQ